jgi:hypothetical protein
MSRSPLALALFLPLALAACDDVPSDDTASWDTASAELDDARITAGPLNTVLPKITGTAQVGSKLTTTKGTWTGSGTVTTTVRWLRCAPDGSACVTIPGATATTYKVTGEDTHHKLRTSIAAKDTTGTRTVKSAATAQPSFAAGTMCAPAATGWAPPDRVKNVIVILFENKDGVDVTANAAAPYFSSVVQKCGSSAGYVDNLFPWDINSLSHYVALTSGSNCNTGLGSTGTGCITDDNSPSSHRLSTTSIFSQVPSWKAYEEDMPKSCDWSSPASGTNYYAKHNPPAYFSTLADCGTKDIGIARISCSSSANGTCTAPSNQLTTDLANDTLPSLSFVTPDIINDMHDGTVSQGDNWLKTYLPLITKSPAYLRGDVAVYVLWDEQESYDGGAMPNLFVSPYIEPVRSTVTMNHFSALRAMEDQLGVGTLGCAGGTAPGGGSCPAGSTADVRAAIGF